MGGKSGKVDKDRRNEGYLSNKVFPKSGLSVEVQ